MGGTDQEGDKRRCPSGKACPSFKLGGCQLNHTCKYFGTPEGCKYDDDNCKYEHASAYLKKNHKPKPGKAGGGGGSGGLPDDFSSGKGANTKAAATGSKPSNHHRRRSASAPRKRVNFQAASDDADDSDSEANPHGDDRAGPARHHHHHRRNQHHHRGRAPADPYADVWGLNDLEKKFAQSATLGTVMAAMADDATLGCDGIAAVDGAGPSKEEVGKAVQKMKEQQAKLVSALASAQRVSMCFVVDTTGSMRNHIKGVKDQIFEIVKQVTDAGCKVVGLAFVGYKDWSDGDDHFEVLPFTTDVARFQEFVGGLTARGGGDDTEDVLGGLDKATRLEWPKASGGRMLFHMCDAPPHGHMYHDKGPDCSEKFDQYAALGHPPGKPVPSAKEIFSRMREQRLRYFFGKMNEHCNKMVKVFSEEAGFDVSEVEVDTAAVESIKSSVSLSMLRVVAESSAARALPSSSSSRVLLRRFLTIDKTEPNFDEIPGIQKAQVMCFQIPVDIEAIKRGDGMMLEKQLVQIKVAPRPFDSGACRFAFYGQTIYKKKEGMPEKTEQVFKEFKDIAAQPQFDQARYLQDMKTQVIASKICMDFMGAIKRANVPVPCTEVKYIKAKMVAFQDPETGSQRFMAMERKYLGGSLEKFTNNLDFVRKSDDEHINKITDMLVALSHFSHSYSQGAVLLTDLQGLLHGEDRKKLLLTDPAIHCATHARRFGATDMGQKGMDIFFQSHICNDFCRKLNLPVTKPSKSVEKTGRSVRSDSVASMA